LEPGNNAFLDNFRIESNTGLQSADKAGLSRIAVYPNPLRGDEVQIRETNSSASVSLQVMDVTGRVLFSKGGLSLEDGAVFSRQMLNIESKGIYYLRFSQKAQTITRKIVLVK